MKLKTQLKDQAINEVSKRAAKLEKENAQLKARLDKIEKALLAK